MEGMMPGMKLFLATVSEMNEAMRLGLGKW